MNIHNLQLLLKQWHSWSKGQNHSLTKSIEQMQQLLDQPIRIFWTGDRQQAIDQLTKLLNTSQITQICTQVVPMPIVISYDANTKIELIHENGETQKVSSEQFIQLAKDVKNFIHFKELRLYVANVLLKNREIVFMPFDCKNISVAPDIYSGIVIATNQNLETEQAFVRHIPRQYVNKLYFVQPLNEFIVLEQVREMLQQAPEVNIAKGVLQQIVRITAQFVPMTQQAVQVQQIERFKQQHLPAHQLHKLEENVQALERVQLAVQQIDDKTLASHSDLTKCLPYLKTICESLKNPELLTVFDRVQAYVNDSYAHAENQYEKNLETFRIGINSQAANYSVLQQKWQQVKNPYYFFGGFKRFKKKLDHYNMEVPHALDDEYKNANFSAKKLTSEAAVVEQKINNLCAQIIAEADAQKAQLMEQFKEYEIQFALKVDELYEQKRQSLQVVSENYSYMNAIFQQITISYDENSQKIQQHLQQMKQSIDSLENYASYTPAVLPMLSQASEITGVSVKPNVIKETQLKQFLPSKIDINFELIEEKIYFRRYKINAAIFLMILFGVGMFSTSTYAEKYLNLSQEDDFSYPVWKYIKDTPEKVVQTLDQSEYEADEDPYEEEAEIVEQADVEEKVESEPEQPMEESYSVEEESYSTDEATDYEYAGPSNEEMDHMTTIAYRALTEDEAYNAETTPNTDYYNSNSAVYDEAGNLIHVASDDYNSKKLLIDEYSIAMKDVLNGSDKDVLMNIISPFSSLIQTEDELFSKLSVLEEGAYELLSLNIDPSEIYDETSIGVIQTFKYTSPAGNDSYFETRSNFEFTYDGENLYIYDIIRYKQ